MQPRAVLLSNVLDALDRLFDRKADAVDVYAIAYATARALPTDEHTALLFETVETLDRIIRSGTAGAEAYERSLDVTNALRVALAEDSDLE